MDDGKLVLGIDAGSVSVNTVLINDGKVTANDYTRIKADPVATLVGVLEKILKSIPADAIRAVGTTGSGGKLIARLLDGDFVNEVIAQAKSIEHFYPEVRTAIDIGGEDSKIILLRYDDRSQAMVIEDFAMNTICAAGTGSFLDQQAVRLGVSIEDKFGELALRSKKPPRIAGRCSVFAKTDMIHLQQEGAPDYDIIAGLCFALARNFKNSICKGKHFTPPVIFQGGVAANKGMVRAFREILQLKENELIIPRYSASMGAIGAAILCKDKAGKSPNLERLKKYLENHKYENEGLPPLTDHKPQTSVLRPQTSGLKPGGNRVKGYLGIDVGSISTNVVVINKNGDLLARRYLMTAGRPIEAVRQGIREVGEEVAGFVEVAGVGTTGSGRYLTGDFVGADVIKNEITAQARASVHIDPTVDTIFEIGGQDSKFISIEDTAVVDFEMNKVCAAGTGSFLEEQAERLSIKIEKEFGNLALSSNSPVRLGERCTVFMESDLLHHQQAMAEREDLVAGLSYSIVYNYLNMVVGKRRIGKNIFFQGAVAFNQGVVAAFEKVLGKKLTVPPNNDVTGAIGVALVAKEGASGWNETKFKGWEKITNTQYELRSFECPDCPNHCEIREVIIEGSKPLHYGSRCEKYNVDKQGKKGLEGIPDCFAERVKLLLESYSSPNSTTSLRGASATKQAPRVGIPYALIFHEQFPFWKAFFTELGFKVILSQKTNKTTIRKGLEKVVAETCFPVKVAHGHIMDLLEKNVDYIFLPMVVNMRQPNVSMTQSFNCPYVQAFPYIAKSAIDFEKHGVKVLNPTVAFGWGESTAAKMLMRFGKELNKEGKDLSRAISSAWKAQADFYGGLRKRGKEILNSLPPDRIPIVIVSRPYNGCDNGINLNLPRKLRDLGAFPIPMDYLPLDTVDLSDEWPDMYWRYGQKILSAAEIIYITNFGCGPDSFITRFFREKMTGKPYLEIEVDEHSADVGAITRCEAFLDSLENVKSRGKPLSPEKRKAYVHSPGRKSDRTVYIPRMGDGAFALQAALRAQGIKAEMFPESNEETLRLGRNFTSGKECYPCILTTGDMVRITKRDDFDPERAAFFMPSTSGPCRFGQYNRLQRMVLDELGFEKVPIISPNQAHNLQEEMKGYGKNMFRNAWRGIVAIDILNRMSRQTRPYEATAGETDSAYKKCLSWVLEAVEEKRSPHLALRKSVDAFKRIETNGNEQKPIIGIVGEIFVRSNEFSNNGIVREIEELGGEVWLAPLGEWFFHVNRTLKAYSLLTKRYRDFVSASVTNLIQRYDEKKLAKETENFLHHPHEPSIRELWANSERYLPGWFGETALSVGKSADYVRKGISGLINVMPFTCLPGTIATAIFKRFQEDHDGIPCLMMAYDGLEQTNTRTRLEAFMHQANQYRRLK
jgi:predicted CoA-substrate-specific enzyme activase